MGSLFHDFSLAHDQYGVGFGYGGQLMSDDDRRLAVGKALDGLHGLLLGGGIEAHCWLVEKEDRSIAKEGPGYGNPPFLPPRESRSILPQRGLITLSQSNDEFVRFCSLAAFTIPCFLDPGLATEMFSKIVVLKR